MHDDSQEPLDKKDHFSSLSREEVMELLAKTKDFNGKDFRKANLTKLDLSHCSFKGTNFSYAVLKDAKLKNCNFKESSLWNANLEGADLTGANLEGCDLDYAKMRGAILYRANIRRAQLPLDLIPREDILHSVEHGGRIAKAHKIKKNSNPNKT